MNSGPAFWITMGAAFFAAWLGLRVVVAGMSESISASPITDTPSAADP